MKEEKSGHATLDIVVPVYNTACYLEECIKSIVDQTFTDWHLIIIDDGSTDDSPAICDRWAAADSRISVLHKPNTGQGDCRNVALSMCSADYIGFVDSDDWIEQDMYSTLIALLQEQQGDIAICSHVKAYPKNKKKKKPAEESVEVIDNTTANHLIINGHIQSYVWQMVFRRECIICDMPNYSCFEDYAVLPHWFEKAKRIVITNRQLYNYRMRASSAVHEYNIEREMAFIEAEEQRAAYYKGTRFGDEIEVRLVSTCIRAAKYIARMKTLKRTEKYHYLGEIRQRLVAIDRRFSHKLNAKNRLLHFLLINNLPVFIAYQKTETKIIGDKHKEKKEVFA